MDHLSSISVIGLILQAGIVVKSVMFFLFAVSIFSWAIIFDKIIKFRILKLRTEEFEYEFENMMIEDLMSSARNKNNHPMSRIFLACMDEWKLNNVKQIIESGYASKDSLKNRLQISMEIAAAKSITKLESSLYFLAIIGSVAPFVGLFGTVWGILSSFQNIAISKNASLAVVAPGIAEALLATAIGLFAAIPAVFFYNIFSNKINIFSEKMNNFSLQLINILSRELDR